MSSSQRDLPLKNYLTITVTDMDSIFVDVIINTKKWNPEIGDSVEVPDRLYTETSAENVGTVTIEVEGVDRPVTIRRDRFGIPHITAENDVDAWFGLGFCQGQDRSFQIETLQRVVRGTTAALIGRDSLDLDRLARRIGFLRAAEAQQHLLDADDLRGDYGVREVFFKPFSMLELIARVRALMRRTELIAATLASDRAGGDERLAVDGLVVDPVGHLARLDDEPLDLSLTEFDLLHLLLRWQDDLRLDLAVAHLDHGLRPDSAADAAEDGPTSRFAATVVLRRRTLASSTEMAAPASTAPITAAPIPALNTPDHTVFPSSPSRRRRIRTSRAIASRAVLSSGRST